MTDAPNRERFPLSWLFHANTMRWAHNAEPPPEDAYPMDPRETPSRPLLRFGTFEMPEAPLADLLDARSSCRKFSPLALEFETLGGLLRAGYGVLGSDHDGRLEFPRRPVPSGGGLYPLELTLIVRNVTGLAPGIYHYVPEHHGLECLTEVDVPKVLLDYLFMGQASLTAAPVLVVLSAEWRRSMTKYGNRGYRYILFEAGHVMQTINLACLMLGLGSCNIGGFFDVELGELLKIDSGLETPLYACALGIPANASRMAMRDL